MVQFTWCRSPARRPARGGPRQRVAPRGWRPMTSLRSPFRTGGSRRSSTGGLTSARLSGEPMRCGGKTTPPPPAKRSAGSRPHPGVPPARPAPGRDPPTAAVSGPPSTAPAAHHARRSRTETPVVQRSSAAGNVPPGDWGCHPASWDWAIRSQTTCSQMTPGQRKRGQSRGRPAARTCSGVYRPRAADSPGEGRLGHGDCRCSPSVPLPICRPTAARPRGATAGPRQAMLAPSAHAAWRASSGPLTADVTFSLVPSAVVTAAKATAAVVTAAKARTAVVTPPRPPEPAFLQTGRHGPLGSGRTRPSRSPARRPAGSSAHSPPQSSSLDPAPSPAGHPRPAQSASRGAASSWMSLLRNGVRARQHRQPGRLGREDRATPRPGTVFPNAPPERHSPPRGR
jgi:hypothetical protein